MITTMLLAISLVVPIHDDADWIGKQGLRNQFGEWCCGIQDCQPIDPANVIVGIGGYHIRSNGSTEIIPYSETMPLSPDGRLWVCRRPDGARRCVFDRPPSM